GKSTLMNLLSGLIRPSKGSIEIAGTSPDHPEELHHRLGYCTQHQTFPEMFTGFDWLVSLLRIATLDGAEARRLATAALDRVALDEPRGRRIGSYRKGMRQRLKPALAVARSPEAL